MDILLILVVGAVTFGLCYLLDKGFSGAFRNKPQHKTGRSVRLSQHYGGAGVLLIVLGIAAVFRGLDDSKLLLLCGILIAIVGLGLVVYYMSFGIYYDDESFVLTTFSRKSKTYAYKEIKGQKLYQVTGGSVMVELYLTDGRTAVLQSTMKGAYPFLDTAFAGWCVQTGRNSADCPFYKPEESCWFPDMED